MTTIDDTNPPVSGARPGAGDVVRPRWTTDNLMSLQSHILAEEQKHPGASGDFSWILSAIALAAKAIADKVRHARIVDVLGDHGGGDAANVHGETQQKLDVIANEIIMRCLGERANIAVLASEEDEEPAVLRSRDDGGRYCVLFDPLDGSSNLNYGVGVGTIFSILRNERRKPREIPHYLQPGWRQAAAGYVLYGSSTVFVLTTGNGVSMFVLDLAIGAFVRVREHLRMPASKKVYSVNEAYRNTFPEAYRRYLDECHANGWSSRYIGSMVADVHRTLLQGGVFLYPPTESHPQGKLRLMYEANPMAMIVEQAGGRALAGTERILDVKPTDLHQRTSVVLGSADHVGRVAELLAEAG